MRFDVITYKIINPEGIVAETTYDQTELLEINGLSEKSTITETVKEQSITTHRWNSATKTWQRIN